MIVCDRLPHTPTSALNTFSLAPCLAPALATVVGTGAIVAAATTTTVCADHSPQVIKVAVAALVAAAAAALVVVVVIVVVVVVVVVTSGIGGVCRLVHDATLNGGLLVVAYAPAVAVAAVVDSGVVVVSGALADGGEASEQRRAARAVAQVQVVRFEGELQTPRLSQRRVEQPLADLSLIHKVHQ
jgi:hypothetical protein